MDPLPAGAEFEDADKKLNAVYGRLMEILDAEGQQKLKAAQRAWITFRDASAELAGTAAKMGTAEGALMVGEKLSRTQTRTKELEEVR